MQRRAHRTTGIALLLALTLLAFAGGVEAKEWKKVRIATEGSYPPWNMIDASGKLTGFEIDLGNDLCRRMKVECEWIAQEWEGLIPGLNAGKFDAIMAGMGATEKRRQVVDFSDYYAYQASQFVAPKAGPLAKSVPVLESIVFLDNMTPEATKLLDDLKKSLKGKVLGAQISTTQSKFLDMHFKEGSEIREYKTAEQVDLDLAAGRIDAAVVSLTYLKPLLVTDKGKDLTLIGPVFRGNPFPVGNGVALRKDETDLKNMLNAAIAEAIKDGTIKKLSLQWFKYDVIDTGRK